MIKEVEPTKTFIGRFSYGRDLLDELTEICVKKNISLGAITGIGAVQKAKIGFYDQKLQKYSFLTFDYPMEITSLVGNVSLKDKKQFVHAHITLSDKNGKCFGGHLTKGTIAFAGEFLIQSFFGESLNRYLNKKTGLFLWDLPIK